MYQTSAAQLAPAIGTMTDSVRRAVSVALQAKDLDEHERQFLYDLARKEDRYGFRSLDRLLKILSRVEDETLAVSFTDDQRGAILATRQRRAAVPIRVALQQETAAECAANTVQLLVALDDEAPLAAVDAALEATRRDIDAGRTMESSLLQRRFQLIHGTHA